MKDFVIVTDSTTDLPMELANELGLVVMPLKYHYDDLTFTNYLDYREQDVYEFYSLVKSGKMPTTSQLIPEDYKNTIEPILKDGKNVLVLSFSSKLSGTYNSARIASLELNEMYPNNLVEVIDTKSASLGEGLLATLVAKFKNEGNNLEDTKKYALEMIPKIAHWFTVDDLSHLRRGGRISGAALVVGKALNIKPILHTNNEGELISRTKAISRKRSIKALFNKMTETALDNQEIVYIGHGADLEAANELASLVKEKYPNAEVLINTIGPVIGAHTGQGVLALFFLSSER